MGSTDPANRYSYQFGGLIVESSMEIGALLSANWEVVLYGEDSRITIQISNRPLLSSGELIHTWRGRYDLSLYKLPGAWVFRSPTGLEFGVNPTGSIIKCFTGSQGWSSAMTETLIRRILPQVVQLQDRHVIHGAALATPSGAILLCGYSHAGKSTLATSLSQVLGWGLLDDDIAILSEHADWKGLSYFKLHPAGVSACLWADSLEALSSNIVHSERLAVHESKFRCELPNKNNIGSQTLRAIYQLAPNTSDCVSDGDITIDRIAPREGLTLLVTHQVRFDPTDAEAEVKRLAFVAKMASTVHIRVLSFPRIYNRLQEVCGRIRDDLITLAQDSHQNETDHRYSFG